MPYREALEHLNQCLGEIYFCPFKCTSLIGPLFPSIEENGDIFDLKFAIKGCDLKEHFKKCPTYELTCKNCEIKVPRYKVREHNCLKSLKQEAMAQKLKVVEKKEMFGMNYERYEPKCNNNHTLLAYRGFPYEHGQV